MSVAMIKKKTATDFLYDRTSQKLSYKNRCFEGSRFPNLTFLFGPPFGWTSLGRLLAIPLGTFLSSMA